MMISKITTKHNAIAYKFSRENRDFIDGEIIKRHPASYNSPMPYVWHDFNDIWDYSDPAATEAVFRSLLASSEGSGDDYIQQLKTQIARTFSLRRMFAEAQAVLDEVEAAMQSNSLVEVRYLLERGRAFNSAKQPEKAMQFFSQASALGERLGADYFTVDALHMLAIAAPAEAQLDWNLKAIDYAQRSTDERARGWLASLFNNTGWSLFDAGRYAEALDLFQKAVPLREQKGDADSIRIAKWSVAKVLRYLGRVDEALAMHLASSSDDGFRDEEIAECLLALGRGDEARPHFASAYDKLSEIDWVAEDTQRMARLKELAAK
jgi:tetratricopeptide (TPR) repeat protein